MEREHRLLAIVQAQTEIAAARLHAGAVMATVVERAMAITGADGAIVEILDADQSVRAHAGGTAAPQAFTRVTTAESICAIVAAASGAVRCDDTGSAERDAEAGRRLGAGSFVCAPLVHESACVGALALLATDSGHFGTADEETLTLFAGVLAAHLTPAAAHDLTDHQPMRDALTGAGNRRGFDARLAHECARRQREGGPLTLVVLDIEGFSALADTHGRAEADGVSRTVAAVLQRWTRTIDGIYRIADGRFALILPSATSEAAHGLLARVAGPLADAHRLPIAVSYGVAEATGEDPARLYAAACAELERATQDRRGAAAA